MNGLRSNNSHQPPLRATPARGSGQKNNDMKKNNPYTCPTGADYLRFKEVERSYNLHIQKGGSRESFHEIYGDRWQSLSLDEVLEICSKPSSYWTGLAKAAQFRAALRRVGVYITPSETPKEAAEKAEAALKPWS